jgi:hypothetical protein
MSVPNYDSCATQQYMMTFTLGDITGGPVTRGSKKVRSERSRPKAAAGSLKSSTSLHIQASPSEESASLGSKLRLSSSGPTQRGDPALLKSKPKSEKMQSRHAKLKKSSSVQIKDASSRLREAGTKMQQNFETDRLKLVCSVEMQTEESSSKTGSGELDAGDAVEWRLENSCSLPLLSMDDTMQVCRLCWKHMA